MRLARKAGGIVGAPRALVHSGLRIRTKQEGYGAFSIGASQVDEVVTYIAHQEEHHRLKSFQEEYLSYLRAYGIKYDERYVWG